jgi:hypothetical protein
MAAAVVARIPPRLLMPLPAPSGAAVAYCIGDDWWTLLRRDDGGWDLLDGRADDPIVTVRVGSADAAA